MSTPRPRITLTADEIAWLLRGHRDRLVELLTRPQVTRAAKALARVAAKHHQTRIALLRAASDDMRDVSAGG